MSLCRVYMTGQYLVDVELVCWQTSDGNSCDSRDTNANKYVEDQNHVGANEDEKAVTTHSFDFPTEMCGRLIGQRGRNVAVIKEKSGAEIVIRAKRYDSTWQIVTLEGEIQFTAFIDDSFVSQQ